jgi:hypothetical protein
MICRTLMLLTAGALLAAGCQPSTLRTPEADRVVRRIESGRHRMMVPPTCLLTTSKKLFRAGDDIRVTVRIISPVEDKALNPYLPIKGRFHVKRDGAISDLPPRGSSAWLAWAEIPPDNGRERDCSFTQHITKLFPMTRLGWYTIWWEGRDDLRQKVRSGDIYVRIMARVPRDK